MNLQARHWLWKTSNRDIMIERRLDNLKIALVGSRVNYRFYSCAVTLAMLKGIADLQYLGVYESIQVHRDVNYTHPFKCTYVDVHFQLSTTKVMGCVH